VGREYDRVAQKADSDVRGRKRKPMDNWYKKRSAADFSFAAILIILFSQYFTFKLIREAKIQTYIEGNSSYNASIQFIEMTKGRNAVGLYRLLYSFDVESGRINCDVLIRYTQTSFSPYFEKNIRVTPRDGRCDDPYLTDLEYWPRLNAIAGAAMTYFASILLVISSLKLKQQAAIFPDQTEH
jgi:hypothetical protein